MIFVGIDPGLDGAVAILHENRTVEFYDTPTVAVGKKRDYDLVEMRYVLNRLNDFDTCTQEPLVGLEHVHAGVYRRAKRKGVCPACKRPFDQATQGVVSAFGFGGGFRAWEMALVCLGLSYELISPQRWKAAMMEGQPKDKDATRVVACQLFPHAASDLKLKKHHGRADALLIAEYLRRST